MNVLMDSPLCAKSGSRRLGFSFANPASRALKLAVFSGFLVLSGQYPARGGMDRSSGFVPGEVSRYKVTWMGIPLAWSESKTDTIEENGRTLIRFRIVSKNYKAYTYIYKVNSATEVIVDPETALPLRLDVMINEGKVHKSHLTTFRHDDKVAIFQDRLSKETKEVKIAERTQDIYSFLYSARLKDLEKLAAQEHTLCVDGKPYKLGLKIRKEGRIKLPEHGKVDCIQVEPIAEFDGLFLRKGKIFFWVSKHKHRIITRVEAKVAVGRVKVTLQKVSGTGDRFWDKEG